MKKIENKKAFGIIFITLIICILSILFIFSYLNLTKQTSYASLSVANQEYTNGKAKNQIDLNEIINKNTETILKEELITQQIDLEYTTKYEETPTLAKGKLQVIQEGRDGIQEVIIKKTYEGETLLKEEIISSKVKKGACDKIVQIGTGSGGTYKISVGDNMYVASNLLSVKYTPDVVSDKIITLNKNDEVKILEIKDEWYKISCNNYAGWVEKDYLTSINQNASSIDTSGSTYTKAELLNKLSFNMSLNKPSGLSLEQFKKALTNSNDKNKVFQNNAQYFYYIEKQYNINGIFVAAVGIHESGWGTSRISLDKKNLFGYGAYDSSPYNSAYSFSTYSEGIDLIARVFVKYYLNPKGTKIYDGQTADASYYNGPTLSGVNQRYATDKNWANAVYNHMKTLYNNI